MQRVDVNRLDVVLQAAGWSVKGVQRHGAAWDFRVRHRNVEYSVELKAASEGRSDRLIPLFAQSALQLMNNRSHDAISLAVISAPRIPHRSAEQVLEFAAKYAPDVALGLFDFEGLQLFRGPELEELNAEPAIRRAGSSSGSRRESRHLFSDLNQ